MTMTLPAGAVRLSGEGGGDEGGGAGGGGPVADLAVAQFDEPPCPVGSPGQVGGQEFQPEGADERGERRQVQIGRRLVAGRVGVRGDEPAGAPGPPGADLGRVEPLEAADDEAAGEVVVAEFAE